MYGCTIALDSLLEKRRSPLQTTTAAPGNAVNPPITPPTMPTRTGANQPPRVDRCTLSGFNIEYAAYTTRNPPKVAISVDVGREFRMASPTGTPTNPPRRYGAGPSGHH